MTFLAYNGITGLMWSGTGFEAEEIGTAKPVHWGEAVILRHTYANVVIEEWERGYNKSATIRRSTDRLTND